MFGSDVRVGIRIFSMGFIELSCVQACRQATEAGLSGFARIFFHFLIYESLASAVQVVGKRSLAGISLLNTCGSVVIFPCAADFREFV